jgi:hypothetical protein
MATKISELFNMEPHEVEMEVPTTDIVPTSDPSKPVEDVDFEHARKNQYELMDQGRAAVNTAMKIAAQSDNPRAIEVLAGLLKNVSEMNRQLVTMNKDLAETKIAKTGKGTSAPAPQTIGTQNILFTGNGAELNKLIAEKMGTK